MTVGHHGRICKPLISLSGDGLPNSYKEDFKSDPIPLSERKIPLIKDQSLPKRTEADFTRLGAPQLATKKKKKREKFLRVYALIGIETLKSGNYPNQWAFSFLLLLPPPPRTYFFFSLYFSPYLNMNNSLVWVLSSFLMPSSQFYQIATLLNQYTVLL